MDCCRRTEVHLALELGTWVLPFAPSTVELGEDDLVILPRDSSLRLVLPWGEWNRMAFWLCALKAWGPGADLSDLREYAEELREELRDWTDNGRPGPGFPESASEELEEYLQLRARIDSIRCRGLPEQFEGGWRHPLPKAD